jgi:transcriptional regulator with XRE-family HTH domain
MSQGKLAEAADLSLNGIQKIEASERSAKVSTISQIAEALNIAPYQLLMPDPYAIDPKPVELPPDLRTLAKDNAELQEELKEAREELESKQNLSSIEVESIKRELQAKKESLNQIDSSFLEMIENGSEVLNKSFWKFLTIQADEWISRRRKKNKLEKEES